MLECSVGIERGSVGVESVESSRIGSGLIGFGFDLDSAWLG